MQTHQAFIEQQTALHHRFLQMRSQATELLAGRPRTDAPGRAPRPIAPAPASISTRASTPAPVRAPVPKPPLAATPEPVTKTTTVARAPTAPAPKPASVEPAPAAPAAAKPAMRPTPPALRVAFSPFPFPDHVPVPDAADVPGPTMDRLDLELHGSGRISRIYGEAFGDQDGYAWQCRMPEPPLLLADRVLGIDAPPLEFGTGHMWTETDITEDRWFVRYDQRIPPCLMIESGQADLMLISWMGIDPLNNHDERVYRLLGCDLTFRGPLPRVGETLSYKIHIDGHANQGPVRLFFFHYDGVVDGEPRISVRNGQAGFFTPKELEDSAGVLWEAEGAEHDPTMRLDPPLVLPEHRAFSTEQLHAFADGDGYACFGKGFERLASHTRTPRMQAPPMLIMDRISEFDPTGGPWGRGYMRVELDIHPDDWFFEGHFKNDPCMPGTLMAEGCLQAMAFYLAAMGFTLERDGWRFEPVPDHTVPLRCRGQTTPTSKRMTCELFIESIEDGPHPTIYADLLGSSDGLKSFWARRMGLRLVPDWPLETCVPELPTYVEPEPVAIVDGFKFDYASLLACAWGKPSTAFSHHVAHTDDGRIVPRLPGAPYHFLSRVTSVEGPILGMEVGSTVDVAWDIPEDAWYFDANGCRVMPFAVLLEAALQPCGWLASYVGSAFNSDQELRFRNLDGDGEVLCEVMPTSGTLRTHVELTRISQSAGMIIESFDVLCRLGDVEVYRLKTVFGFFPAAALENQRGVGQKPADEARIAMESAFAVDLTTRPEAFFSGSLHLPERPLLMLDRLSGYWPEGGEAGLGRMRGEKDVFPEEWCFKLHFFSDPVQPGSLGLAALIQLLQALILEKGLASELHEPRFEAIATAVNHGWKYRGQVPPNRERITSEVEIREVRRDEAGLVVIGSGFLWCDGLCIYQFHELPIRVVEGAEPEGHQAPRREDGQPLPAGTQVPSGAWETPGRLLQTMPGRPAREARLADFHASHVRRAELTQVWGGIGEEVMHDAPHARVGERDPLTTAIATATGLPLPRIVDGGSPHLPLSRFELDGDTLIEQLDLGPVQTYWAEHFGQRDWPAEDLFFGLVQRFTRRVRFEDPDLPGILRDRGALFVANHQTALESLTFIVLSGGLFGRPTSAIAKDEHRATWMGRLNELVFRWPDVQDPGFLAFFDRSDPASLPALLGPLFADAGQGARSILVHVDGTRATTCREPVGDVSGTLVDAALAAGLPIVPVRFEGGLPLSGEDKLAFPHRYGQQDVVFGRALPPDTLADLPLKARKATVVEALRELGTPRPHRMPLPGRPAIVAEVARWMREHPAEEAWAVIATMLDALPSRGEVADDALRAAKVGDPESASSAWATELARFLHGQD